MRLAAQEEETGVEMAICAAGGTTKYQGQWYIEVCERYRGSALMAARRAVSQVGLDCSGEGRWQTGMSAECSLVADARRFLPFFLEALRVE
jgi:hypothetical protein